MTHSILKPILLSLSAGTLLWIGLLTAICLYLEPDATRPTPLSQGLDASPSMTLDAAGSATRMLHKGTLHAGDLPLLHLRLQVRTEDNVKLALRWRSSKDTTLPPLPLQFVDNDIWFFLAGQRHWQGDVSQLELLASGRPGAQLTVLDATLQPLTLGTALRSLHWHWTRAPDWSLQSVNAYRAGWPEQSVLQPALAIALWVFLAMLSYGALRLVPRCRPPVLPVLGSLCLVGWLTLDLLWMHRLVQQHEKTRGTLAGKSDIEKALSGQDRGLFALAEKVQAAVPDDDSARVFVVSGNDYIGMRSTYYLMPLNTYWHRHEELPDRQHLQRGDFILLLPPAETAIDVQRRALRLPGAGFLPVRPVTGDAHGTLFQVL